MKKYKLKDEEIFTEKELAIFIGESIMSLKDSTLKNEYTIRDRGEAVDSFSVGNGEWVSLS